ncbi:putative bifunctional diguanylate cyclase/phosphodiesterase [Methylibium rhizosphaerae]|uniref:putative bifunctional diguanylate cyclase/phosphodiesterase n=1 Tax=Methylibium rhizosphaerae TaxID=2570323 RepID=UPI0015E3D502|nr:EAL domain-containing protein [Methylibium rhizosphaerae]
MKPHRLTLRTRLALSFAGAGLLVVALLLVGHRVVREAALQQEEALTAQVRPLARINRLQSQISRIRVLEVELPRLTDLFAVANQLELLEAERRAFDRELSEFTGELREQQPAAAAVLDERWRRYQAELEGLRRHVKAMDLAAAQRLATFESAERFKAVSHTLKQLAEGTESQAAAALAQARGQQGRQLVLFLAMSAFGLVALALWTGLLARSVSGRISRLRDAAARVAEGQGEQPVPVSGNDELADLGLAFNTMQAKVAAREKALRAAHDELDARVAQRTQELHSANEQLLREIDERRRAEQRLAHQAQYDSLTDLPNRMLAMDRLSQAMLAAQRGGHHVVLIFLDLDDFKKVNDTLGHPAGDALLVQAAARLRHAVRAGDTVARHGGDEFLVILGGLTAPEDAEVIAEKILRAFAPPFSVGENEVVVSPSLGLAVYPDDGDEGSLLLRNADLAMYDAKDSGRNTFRYFNQQVHDSSVQRLAIEHSLRSAASRDEFELVYQPLVAAAGGQVVGAEALLRWRSAEHGYVLPDHFISVAEHTGLIVDIGDWVLRTACEQLRAWHDAGWSGLHMAVNVSPRQFRGDRLLRSVRECLAVHRFAPGGLQVEVTEGLLIRNQPEVHDMLAALSGLGVRLAMDDFGTGYSSLSYLKRFPFDAIKIDRGFVRDVASDPDDRALVIAAIRMGKGLGLSVVAEGVETEQQRAFLAEQGCDVLQGFLFGAPLPADAFAQRWLGSTVRTAPLSARTPA